MSAYAGTKNAKHNDTAQRGNVKFYENFNLQLMNGMRTMKLLFVTSEICGEERAVSCKKQRAYHGNVHRLQHPVIDRFAFY